MSATGNDSEPENATKADGDATICSSLTAQEKSVADNDTKSEELKVAKDNKSEAITSSSDIKAETCASSHATKSEYVAPYTNVEVANVTNVEHITCADTEMASATAVKPAITCTDIQSEICAVTASTCPKSEAKVIVIDEDTEDALIDDIFMQLTSETPTVIVENVAANVTVAASDEASNPVEEEEAKVEELPRAQQLRDIVLNARKPLVLRKFQPPWGCFGYSLEEWCRKFDAASTDLAMFELNTCDDGNKSPHWERKREPLRLTALEFLYEQNLDKEYWIGLNYKRASDFPAAVRADVDFGCFGFSGVGNECNYWLSTKKANTPCHYDTYGCNIVVQVYGRKSWLLFPPETPLTTTRIPYEESSVYCLENFYAPNPREMKKLLELQKYAHRVILEPGDVLIVPRHWWHYVESMEISLSVNYWVPLQSDMEAQTDECIVKFLIERFVKGERREVLKYVLNPNQLDQITDESELFDILKFLYTNTTSSAPESRFKKLKKCRHAYQYLDENQFQKALELLPEILTSEVPHLSADEFQTLLLENSKRLYSLSTQTELPPFNSMKRALINSICSPEVIKCIKDEFFRRYNEIW